METLIIVRRIREAESLAASGKHDDAGELLRPLLDGDGLTDTHRKLISKKIDLFKRQKDRLTRIISRRATSVSVNDSADESSERTAVRQPVPERKPDDWSDVNLPAVKDERKTTRKTQKDDSSERPTGPSHKVPGGEKETEALEVPKSFKPGTRMLTPDMLEPDQVESQKSPTETEVPRLPSNETEAP
ncbi:MAG: hypothetical protein ACYTDT_11810, partial [Planctomycetota bacterium]